LAVPTCQLPIPKDIQVNLESLTPAQKLKGMLAQRSRDRGDVTVVLF
jgi:hypothetical protein